MRIEEAILSTESCHRYILLIAEALGVIIISSTWRFVSFRETHLVERIGLLTLIMMGQGVSGIASSAASLLQNS